MKTATIDNSDLHFEHRHWTGELNFWKDELETFKNRLEEIGNRELGSDAIKKHRYYRNEFQNVGNEFGDLLKEIEIHESQLAGQSKSGDPDSMDISQVRHHVKFRERMEAQRSRYNRLKKDYFKFMIRHH